MRELKDLRLLKITKCRYIELLANFTSTRVKIKFRSYEYTAVEIGAYAH